MIKKLFRQMLVTQIVSSMTVRPLWCSISWGRYPIVMPEGLSIWPEVGFCSPMISFIMVDLPAPLRPTRPILSLSLMWKLILSRRTKPP